MPPRKTPTKIKANRGSARAKSEAKIEAQVQTLLGSPDMPLDLTDYGQEMWGKICKELNTLGVLAVTDAIALEQLIRAYEIQREALGDLNRLRKNNLGADTLPYKKAFAVYNSQSIFIIKTLREFGMTPAGRAGLSNLIINKPPHGNKGRIKKDKYGL